MYNQTCENSWERYANARVSDLPLGDKLESDDLSAALSSALVHFSEGAFTDGVQYVILVHLYT